MIELDVNLSYLTRHFNINAARLNEYRGQTVDKIIQEEVKSGNTEALRFATTIKDPNELSELLTLANVDNRYLIIFFPLLLLFYIFKLFSRGVFWIIIGPPSKVLMSYTQ